MTPSFASAPPSALADAPQTNEFGANSSGRYLNEADRFSLSRIHVNYINFATIPLFASA